MSDFWSFRRMVAPVVIQVLFAVGCILVIIAGVVLLVVGAKHNHTSQALGGVALILFGPLAVRIYAEAVIVVFRINETLTDIRALAVWASERIYAEGEIDEGDEHDEHDDHDEDDET
jgi:uncharacterized membrane protein